MAYNVYSLPDVKSVLCHPDVDTANLHLCGIGKITISAAGDLTSHNFHRGRLCRREPPEDDKRHRIRDLRGCVKKLKTGVPANVGFMKERAFRHSGAACF